MASIVNFNKPKTTANHQNEKTKIFEDNPDVFVGSRSPPLVYNGSDIIWSLLQALKGERRRSSQAE
jgi:hypothetical protein